MNSEFMRHVAGAMRSFVLQVDWPADYPSTSSVQLTLDLFYNQHLLAEVKETILHKLREQAQECIGMAATYTVVESPWVVDFENVQ